MSIAKPNFFFGAGNVANGGPSGPYIRKEARARKGWTAFDVWQDRVRRAAEAVGVTHLETQATQPRRS
jgi:hypothetical protein